MSLTADGEPVETEMDRTLVLLEEMAPMQLSLHDAREEVPPENESRAAQEEAGDELAALAGAPIKKTA